MKKFILIMIVFNICVINYALFDANNRKKIDFQVEKTKIVIPKPLVVKEQGVYQQINHYLQGINFNGTVAIMKKNQLVMNQGYGYQDFEKQIKNNPNSMFLIGSAQKFLTGTMLKQLEEKHLLTLNDPVNKYIKNFSGNTPMTLRDLMLHQSGLPKYQGDVNIHSLDEAVQRIQNEGVMPNEFRKHLYNDANYLVLSKVIENVTRQPYENYFKEHFIKQYNLQTTGFYNDKNLKHLFAKGYKYDNGYPEYSQTKYLDQYDGAGNLYMSSQDLAIYISNYQQGNMLSKSITRELLTESKTKKYPGEYRYGYYVKPEGYKRVNGVFFGTVVTSYFNDEYIVVCSSNYTQTKGLNEQALKEIFKTYLKQ